MTQLERLYQLNSFLLNEMPQYKKQALSFGKDEKNQFQLFRSLVNVRPPMPASFQFLKIQDEYLQAELRGKGITDIERFDCHYRRFILMARGYYNVKMRSGC